MTQQHPLGGYDTHIGFSAFEKYLYRILYRVKGEPLKELWSIDSGEQIPLDSISAGGDITISPADNFVLCSDKLCKLPSLDIVQRIPKMEAPCFSPDGKWLAYRNNNPYPTIELISTATGLAVKDFPPGMAHSRFEFSPDSRMLAISFSALPPNNETTGVFDIESNQLVCEFAGAAGRPCFADDGRHAITFLNGGKDALVWDLRSRKQVLRLHRSPEALVYIRHGLAFVADPLQVFDLSAERELWKGSKFGNLTDDGEYVVFNSIMLDSGHVGEQRLVNARTGRIAHRFGLKRDEPADSNFRWEYNSSPRRLLSYYGYGMHAAQTDTRFHRVQLWQRRRPEEWWGYAWLWEFWLVVVLGVGLIWSVFKRPATPG